MDKWGRRIPMIIGGFAMGICMMLIAVIMKTKGIPIRSSFLRLINTNHIHHR
jgi:hypothetical protein